MKNLKNLAQQKQQQQFQQMAQKYPQQDSEEDQVFEEDYDQDYEPTQQQIIEYAHFLGIDPKRQAYLLYIAKEGLVAPLPAQWKPIQNKDDQIYYYNIETSQKIWEHPCDEYYRQLVEKQRIKKNAKEIEQKMKKNSTSSKSKQLKNQNKPLVLGADLKKPLGKQKEVDPLLKIEQEKKQRKMEEQQKQQFQKKKSQTVKKYEEMKEEITRKNQQKQQQLKQKYKKGEEQLMQKYKQENSEKQRTEHNKLNLQLQNYRSQLRSSLQNTYNQRLEGQKSKLQATYMKKKQQMRSQLQCQNKKQRKQIQEDFKRRMRQLQEKQKQLKKQNKQRQNNFQKQRDRLKQQYITTKMTDNVHIIEAERLRQQQYYNQQVQKLQQQHNKRVINLEKQAPHQIIAIQPFLKELEDNYKKQMKTLQYELQAFKELRKVEMQEKLVRYELDLEQAQREKMEKVISKYDQRFGRQKQQIQKQFELKVSQIQKKANDDYLRSLNDLESRYNRQEDNILSHHQSQRLNRKDEQNINQDVIANLNKQLTRIQEESAKLKKQLMHSQLQCQNSRSHLQREEKQKGPVYSKLNSYQKELYDLVSQKQNRIVRDQKQVQPQEM